MDASLDLFEMLRIGQPLPSAAIPSIQERKSSLLRRVARLQRELDDTLTAITHCDGLFAPIRALPREILLHIFFLTEDTSISLTGARAVIGRVCRHWRAISTSSPDLWSKIDISVYRRNPNLTKYSSKPSLSVLAQCLVLSHPRALDISVDFYHGEYIGVEDGFLALLCQHTSRWRSYKHTGACEGIEMLLDKVTHLRRLETLALEYRGKYTGLTMALKTPSLRSLRLNFSPDPTFSPSTSLTTFCGVFDDDWELYGFLAKALSLTSLHVKHIGAGDGAPNPTPIVLNKLRTLTLESCGISPVWRQFTFPGLQEFSMPTTLSSDGGHSTPCINHDHLASVSIIKDLMERSRCPLRSLRLSNNIPPTLFLRLFYLCASTLTSLHVFFHIDIAGDTLPLIQMLTVAEDASAESLVLPHLTDLSFEANTFSDYLFKLEALEMMIRSRWDVKAGVTRLKKLRLERVNLADDTLALAYQISSLSIFLQKLAREGLDVSWVMDSEDILNDGQHSERALRLLAD